MAAPYRESYGEDEYERPENTPWPAPRRGSAWWDDDDYDPDDTEDYLAASAEYFRKRQERLIGSVWYDFSVRRWKCNCQSFEDTGKCRHVHRYRPQETINLIEGYL
jgi:hypothetical protein